MTAAWREILRAAAAQKFLLKLFLSARSKSKSMITEEIADLLKKYQGKKK